MRQQFMGYLEEYYERDARRGSGDTPSEGSTTETTQPMEMKFRIEGRSAHQNSSGEFYRMCCLASSIDLITERNSRSVFTLTIQLCPISLIPE